MNNSKNDFKLVDGHIHLWVDDYSKNFNEEKIKDYKLILNQLREFKESGGSILVDSNPAGTGRNGNILYKLSCEIGVEILAITGFHKKNYYNDVNYKIFNEDLTVEEIESFFTSEISVCLSECNNTGKKKKASLIKIPFLGKNNNEYKKITEAAIRTSKKTNTPIIVHTEEGLEIEYFVDFLKDHKVTPRNVMICHIDKRNDINLHMKLASEGFYLEYDTFFRSKYNPEKNLYPLIKNMITKGYADSIIVASDIYGRKAWENIRNTGGLAGFYKNMIKRLIEWGISKEDIEKIVSANARSFLNVNNYSK